MAGSLRVLVVEDSPDDAELLDLELRRGGYLVTSHRVETAEDFLAALDRESWDVVISDYALPHFSAEEALALLRVGGHDIPFLVVSGVLGEEAAVDAMRNGVSDYILKGRPARLVPAIAREVRDAGYRRALRETERFNQEVIDSLPMHIAVLDRYGWIVAVNRAWNRFLEENGIGDPAAFGIGRNYLEVCLKAGDSGVEDARRAYEGIESVLDGTSPHFSLEYPCPTVEGELWFVMTATRLTAGRNGAVVTHTDITERKRFEQALRCEEERYRVVTECGPQMIRTAQPDGTTDYVNQRWSDYTGMGKDGQPAECGGGVLHPDDLPLVAETWGRSIRSGDPFEAEYRLRSQDGRYRWHIGRALPLRDECGTIIRWIETCIDVHDQKLAEAALRASEARFRAIIEGSFEALLLVDVHGTILYSSPATVRLLGYRPDEEVGKNALTPVHPDDRAGLAAQFRGLLDAPGSSLISVHRARHKDRTWRWLESRFANLLHDPDVAAIVIHTRDITDRKLAEEEQARLAAIVESSEDAVIGTDLEGMVLSWNYGAGKLYGYSAEEMIGRSVHDLHPPEFRDVLPELMRRVAQGQRFSGIECPRLRKDGRRVEIALTLSPIRDPDGRIVGVAGISHDITAQKTLQAQRDDLLARLQVKFDRMPIGCLRVGPDHRLLDWNPAAERIFGYDRDEALGRDVLDLVVPEAVRDQVRDVFRLLLREGTSLNNVNENVTRDGRTITCEWYNTPIPGPDGAPESILCMGIDVTERVRLEDRDRQARKMEAIGRLAGGIAHDFNNLLTIINGYSCLLLDDLPPDDPNRAYVEQIDEAGRRSAGLTKQLLAFGRREVMTLKALDLNAIITDTEKLLRRIIGEDVRLVTSLDPALSPIRADPSQAEQVLLNLAVNARDAMPEGGCLSLETRDVVVDELKTRRGANGPSGPFIELTVRDTGCGMSPEVVSRVFEPYFSTKTPDKGTGLGLAVVHGIVEQSGGWIEVESELGVGTVFRICLPCADPPAAPAKEPTDRQPAARGGSETVLVVEDEEAVRTLTSRALRSSGYHVLEAVDGEKALRFGQTYREPIDLLVTDLVMPGLGGRQLAERLAAHHPETAVLYVSGYTDDAVVRTGLRKDEIHFLRKPFLPNALTAKVREMLDARRQAFGSGRKGSS